MNKANVFVIAIAIAASTGNMVGCQNPTPRSFPPPPTDGPPMPTVPVPTTTTPRVPVGYRSATPEPPQLRPTGIFSANGDLWHEGLAMVDAWQQIVDGSWAWIEVGAYRERPDKGVLYSVWELPNAGFAHFIGVPEGTGPLRIVRAQGYRIELRSADGQTLYFDVPSQQLVSSVEVMAATVTAQPTWTPQPIYDTEYDPCLHGYEIVCSTPVPYP